MAELESCETQVPYVAVSASADGIMVNGPSEIIGGTITADAAGSAIFYDNTGASGATPVGTVYFGVGLTDLSLQFGAGVKFNLGVYLDLTITGNANISLWRIAQ